MKTTLPLIYSEKLPTAYLRALLTTPPKPFTNNLLETFNLSKPLTGEHIFIRKLSNWLPVNYAIQRLTNTKNRKNGNKKQQQIIKNKNINTEIKTLMFPLLTTLYLRLTTKKFTLHCAFRRQKAHISSYRQYCRI